jgi:uncharacterized protein YndB with AHSA1/START domain
MNAIARKPVPTKTHITPDRDAVVSETEIAAPPDRVFQSLITREQTLQWGSNPAFQMTHWEMDARPGGRWRFTSRERGSDKIFDHHGEVLEIEPPRVLAYSWFANWHSNPSHPTKVRWELSPTTTGTYVKVTHSGLAQLPDACVGYSQGWPGLVEALKTYLEK